MRAVCWVLNSSSHPHMVAEAGEFSGASFIRALIPFVTWRLPNASPPNIISPIGSVARQPSHLPPHAGERNAFSFSMGQYKKRCVCEVAAFSGSLYLHRSMRHTLLRPRRSLPFLLGLRALKAPLLFDCWGVGLLLGLWC